MHGQPGVRHHDGGRVVVVGHGLLGGVQGAVMGAIDGPPGFVVTHHATGIRPSPMYTHVVHDA